MIEEHYILDGELYLPGHSVNEINHFVKDPTCKKINLFNFGVMILLLMMLLNIVD